MKILVTSDNHLGFKERDPIRGDDTFNTFEEILLIGKDENVDFILQGGDLFDENRPSRNTYNKILQLLKKYCLVDGTNSICRNKVKFKSDIPLNLNNENLKISMPILSIHGNHDDPSGLNSVSPLDVLNSSGLLDYIGKCNDFDNIVINPILVEKDGIKVAIYGLGHIKDRILYRTFMKGNVKYINPEEGDWFNILIVHQNRTCRPEEYLPEDFIDSFFDLVIYGHEHESLRLYNNKFDVIQCGSTVITNLAEGERHSKNVFILDFKSENFIKKIKLKTVRPFLLEDIKITCNDAENLIKNKLEKMLILAKKENGYNNEMLPLLKLRVELGKDVTFNRHRLNGFLDKSVANPGELIKITRKYVKKEIKSKPVEFKSGICDIYKTMLESEDLNVLIIPRVIEALNDFVDKDIKDSWISLMKDSVKIIMDKIELENTILEDLTGIIKETKNTILKNEYNKENTNFEVKIAEDLFEKNKKLRKNENFDHSSLSFDLIKDKTQNEVKIAEDLFEKNKKLRKNENFDHSSLSFDLIKDKTQNLHEEEKCLFENNKHEVEAIKNSISSYDFTFLEDKREKIENDQIIKECENYLVKNKEEINLESDEDLMKFTNYFKYD